jgi:hypothetical protein
VAAYRIVKTVGNVLPVAGIEEASLDISSVGQIILYLEKANRRRVCRIP